MSTAEPFRWSKELAADLGLPQRSVDAVLLLLEGAATVPFIARYRKELTGSLDEVQIRAIEEGRDRRIDLEERRETVLAAIREQGKLTPALETQLRAATTKQALEDLYLPFKQKRRTRALIARERGLQPLADRILAQPREGNAEREAAAFVAPAKEVVDVDAALAGARDIVAEIVSDSAEVRAIVRDAFLREGLVVTRFADKKQSEPTRFDAYADFAEPVAKIPSHRFLAVLRGEEEKVLKVSFDVDEDRLLPRVEARARLVRGSPFARQLGLSIQDAFKRLLGPSVETDVRAELKTRSDRVAIDVFAENLAGVLLAPPLGPQPVIGIDPGFRTGCKCAVVDGTGRFVEAATIYPALGPKAERDAADVLLRLVKAHGPTAIAVGNGTGGRETEAFVRKVVDKIVVTPVNEAGASVYSASDVARAEFPELDLTIRGAISIARRLQDPLAELVKLDPKAIGVGQYQHDVHQPALQKKLDDVVESCVNRVGVDLNTASAPLLSRVAGIGPSLAKKIVQHRETKGVFRSRAALLDVKGLGERTYEQAAGFLRVRSAAQPLDASGVHPERYPLVTRMARDLGVGLAALVGNAELAKKIDLKQYASVDVGDPTLRDIVAELSKPGRDPRERFEPPRFRDDVREPKDLQPGMELAGVVTNVTAFGAFVDVGVHQDGLVHISQLSDRFVSNPHDVVKPGDRLQVRVISVDLKLGRISLTAKRG
ncbi:MAG: Tex family protein [Deltaproteobacteria bacterium]|nr:Tex family protein [Deltaproteobacteria bacterium]